VIAAQAAGRRAAFAFLGCLVIAARHSLRPLNIGYAP
jgi:hypothetical protein